MKIYVVDDQVQDSLNSGNQKEDSLYISRITTNTIICPINQSIPESKFIDINCDVATSKRKAFTIGVSPGDFCLSYNGKNRIEVMRTVMDYCKLTNPLLINKPRGLIYEDGGIGIVYAPIKNGIEFCFYKGRYFNCNYEEFNESFNANKANCKIDLEDLVSHLTSTFDAEVFSTLPKGRKDIKNMRGEIKSCSTGNVIYNLKKKTYRVRCPLVLDDDVWRPQVMLCGFSGFNNTTFEDGFVTGDITVAMQDDEETIKKILEEKGGVEWL